MDEGSKKLVDYYGSGPAFAVPVEKGEENVGDEEKPAEEETKSDGEEVEIFCACFFGFSDL